MTEDSYTNLLHRIRKKMGPYGPTDTKIGTFNYTATAVFGSSAPFAYNPA